MTLSDLQTLFSRYVNDPYQGYFDPTITTTFINNALIQCQRRVMKMHANYYALCASTPMVIGQSQYALPDDFLALLDVWIVLDDNSTVPMIFIPLSKRHDFIITNSQPSNFYMLKSSLNFVPPPDDTYTLEIVYVPQAPTLVNSSDIPDLPIQYHEMVAVLAAKTALMVDDRQSVLVDQYLAYFDSLLSATEQRIESQPRYIIEKS